MGFLASVFAVQPRPRRARGNGERIGLEREVTDRHEVVHRVDDRHGDTTLRRAGSRTGRALGKTRGGGGEPQARESAHDHDGRLHLTTTTPVMKGWGVQWKA